MLLWMPQFLKHLDLFPKFLFLPKFSPEKIHYHCLIVSKELLSYFLEDLFLVRILFQKFLWKYLCPWRLFLLLLCVGYRRGFFLAVFFPAPPKVKDPREFFLFLLIFFLNQNFPG